MDFVMQCRAEGIRPLIGIEFRSEQQFLYIGIARNKEGMKELNDFLTYHHIHQLALPHRPPRFDHAYVVYAMEALDWELQDHEFVGIRHTELNVLFGKNLQKKKYKMLALHPVTFSGPLQYRFHEYLRAVDFSTLLSKVATDDKCQQTEYFKSIEELEKLYVDYPYLLKNTQQYDMFL